jgi:hypothetical protein
MSETPLIKASRGFLSHFSHPVSEFPLTYNRELVNEAYEDSALFSVGGKEIYPRCGFKHKPYLHSPRRSMTLPTALALELMILWLPTVQHLHPFVV